MSDPNEIGGISVTIKQDEPGGKFNDAKSPGSWIVFHGTPAKVKEQIVEVFELDAAALERPLFDLVNEATALFKGTSNVKREMGGTVLSAGPQNGPDAADGPPWNTDQAAPAKEDVDPILKAIEDSKTVDELKQLWAENQDAFKDDKYMDPWRAKGKSLQA